MNSIDVYFDYVSPFAYLAAETLPAFAARVGIALRWKPIELAALSNYANGLPYSAVKRRYVAIDAVRSAEFHGVPLRLPKPHPVRSGLALRLAIVALDDPRFLVLHTSLFRAAWRDRRDLGATEVLAGCITEAGGPVEDWLRQAAQPATSARLGAATAVAEADGVFGVPSMVFAGELFWGLDSLPALEWRLERARADATGEL